MRIPLVVLAVAALTCGPSPDVSEPLKPNSCATKGAIYSAAFVEMAGGTCGPLPDEILSVTRAGAVLFPTCGGLSNGCMSQANACPYTLDDVPCFIGIDLDFLDGGIGATGFAILTCSLPDNIGCSSTYAVDVTQNGE